VKGAAQAAMLEPAESEVGAAMGAMAIDQAVPALLVAEQDEVLAKQFDSSHRSGALQLVAQRSRLPIHPHQLATRITRSGAGDQIVLFLAHHGGSPCAIELDGACACKQLGVVCSPIEHMFNMITSLTLVASSTFQPGHQGATRRLARGRR